MNALLLMALALVAAVAFCGGGIAGKEVGYAAGRSEGYAAAVDSVRVCERYPFADARNAFGDRFDVTVYDAADSVTAVVHFGRFK